MSLKQKTISGIGWNGAGNVARQVLQVITLVVMARLLSPEAFGVYAILMVFVTFMNVIASMGTSQVIIYMDNPSQRMLSSIFYFNIAIGIVLFALLFFLAWPIADFFENKDLVHLLQIIGLIFIISALSLVQKTLLEKTLFFKRVITLETTALAIGSVAGIIAAVCGLGIYSLLILALAKPAIFSAGLWLNSHWRPSLLFAFEDIKYIWKYSFHLTGFSFITQLSEEINIL
jgi:O-antigen/teichoic acid export membrane protein